MEFEFNFPLITEGYFKITNFPFWFKHSNNEIYTKIEFAHIIYEIENGFNVEKIQFYHYDEYNIECLMFLKLGDKFTVKSKRLKKKNYQLSVWLDSYDKTVFKTVENDHNPIFPIGSKGTKYYQIDTQFKNSSPISIIIPSVVIAQAFFLVNSLIIKSLFMANFDELKELVKWKIKKEGDISIGEVSLKKHGNAKIKSMAKSLAFFLFSKDDYLWKNLLKMQSYLYNKVITNQPKNNYVFLIPIKEKLNLKLNGNYINTDNQTFFLVNEIINVKSEKNFDQLYETDYVTFLDYYNPEENESSSEGDRSKRSKRSSKNKKTTAKNGEVDPDIGENYIESGIDLLSEIVKISIDYKARVKSSSGGLPIYPKTSPYGTFNSRFTEPGSENGATSGGKIHTVNKPPEKREIFRIIYSIMEKLNSHFNISEYIVNNNDIAIFNVSNGNDHALLIDDDFHERIQLVYLVNLKKIESTQIENFIELVKNNKYNWEKLKKMNKDSTGLIIGQSTNYNYGGTRREKFSKKKDGTTEEVRVSDLCYLNVLKKLKNIFPLS